MSEELVAFSKNRKKKALIRIGLVAAIVLLLSGVILWLLLSKFFVVKAIRLPESESYTEEEILEKVGVPAGKALVTVSKKDVIRRIEENFPYLVDVSVRFRLPGTLEISFSEDHGRLAMTLGTETFSINEELVVIAKETGEGDKPRIRLYTDDVARCVVGEKLVFGSADTLKTLGEMVRILEEREMLADVQSIDIREKFNIKLRYLDRFDLVVGEKTDLEYKFAMVEKVVEDLGDGVSGRIDVTDPDTAYVKTGENP
ncbi:MAG: FtsQ-type POTRA domain-containing protein [Clostridia bacterium]|nr:FtsQ-type POTRA domain-containing protein [Clostridia bacterium]